MITCTACSTHYNADEVFCGNCSCSTEQASYEGGCYRTAMEEEVVQQAHEDGWENDFDIVWLCPACVKSFYGGSYKSMDEYIEHQQLENQ